jgi:lipid A ethanolaminephosphotransferase
VASILWLGEQFAEDGLTAKVLQKSANAAYSHDNLFHNVLGLMEIETATYSKELDILTEYRRDETPEQHTRLTKLTPGFSED